MVLPKTVPVWLQTQAYSAVLTLPGSAPLAEFAAPSPTGGSLALHLFIAGGNRQMVVARLLKPCGPVVNPKEVCSKLLLELLTGHRSHLLQAGTLLVDNEGVGRSDVHQMLEHSGGPLCRLPVD